MRETEYAYAVARIRANELNLLSAADTDQLITADNYETACRMLNDKGWAENQSIKADICENELIKTLALISESVPDNGLTQALVTGNDFANLKAAIKCVFSGIPAEDYMTVPCVCDVNEIIRAVSENDYSLLPPYLSSCAQAAYKAISEKQSGQLAEMIIDRACLETRLAFAQKAESGLLTKIVSLLCLVADIKMARRCFSTGKTAEFAEENMCACPGIDTAKMVEAVFAGEELSQMVRDAGYEDISGFADGDFAALEMECDNLIVSYILEMKHEVYGTDPVVAYWYAKVTETKNVRIILSAKAAGVPTEIIRERVRDMYV